jgi:hypothetical protein
MANFARPGSQLIQSSASPNFQDYFLIFDNMATSMLLLKDMILVEKQSGTSKMCFVWNKTSPIPQYMYLKLGRLSRKPRKSQNPWCSKTWHMQSFCCMIRFWYNNGRRFQIYALFVAKQFRSNTICIWIWGSLAKQSLKRTKSKLFVSFSLFCV